VVVAVEEDAAVAVAAVAAGAAVAAVAAMVAVAAALFSALFSEAVFWSILRISKESPSSSE
jgi:hypothetical protein